MRGDSVRDDIFLSLGVSLALTLLLEGFCALLWKVEQRDMPLLFLANLLTNPVVVLCRHGAAALWPEGLVLATLLLELWAVGTEGYLYRTRSRIRRPWRFSIGANLFSYIIGCFL